MYMLNCNSLNYQSNVALFLLLNQKIFSKIKIKIKMMMLSIIFILSLLVMSSCGGGGDFGVPGSSEQPAMTQTWVNIVPAYLEQNDNSNVDVYATDCGSRGIERFETHKAIFNFTVKNVNISGKPELNPKEIFITKYTIHYYPSNDSLGAPPIESFVMYTNYKLDVPDTYNETATTTFSDGILLDLSRKIKYQRDIDSMLYSTIVPDSYLNNYVAVYVFEGYDMWGKKFNLMTHKQFTVNEFNYCQ